MGSFGKRLRNRARELHLADAEVARRAGLNERRYGHYVTGAREPDLKTLARICVILETTPNRLLGFDEDGSILRGDKSGDLQRRATLRARLAAASNALETDNLGLLVKQVEALVRHQREQRRAR